jgi:hypothetical protein
LKRLTISIKEAHVLPKIFKSTRTGHIDLCLMKSPFACVSNIQNTYCVCELDLKNW